MLSQINKASVFNKVEVATVIVATILYTFQTGGWIIIPITLMLFLWVPGGFSRLYVSTTVTHPDTEWADTLLSTWGIRLIIIRNIIRIISGGWLYYNEAPVTTIYYMFVLTGLVVNVNFLKHLINYTGVYGQHRTADGFVASWVFQIIYASLMGLVCIYLIQADPSDQLPICIILGLYLLGDQIASVTVYDTPRLDYYDLKRYLPVWIIQGILSLGWFALFLYSDFTNTLGLTTISGLVTYLSITALFVCYTTHAADWDIFRFENKDIFGFLRTLIFIICLILFSAQGHSWYIVAVLAISANVVTTGITSIVKFYIKRRV